MEKALAGPADALVIDLEDAVADREKDRAREDTAAFLADHRDRWTMVRVSALEDPRSYDDIAAVVAAGAGGILVPKVESAADMAVADRVIAWQEQLCGLPPGSVTLTPVLETAYAIRFCYELATASSRVAYMGTIAARGGDVERSVGFRWTPSAEESATLRSLGLLSMRAAGIQNPITGLWTDIADLEGLAAFARRSRDIGYEGMFVIHPSHLATVNEAFSIGAEEVEYYRALVEALEQAEQEGRAAITFRGSMIDIAMLVTARQVLRDAGERS